MYPAPLDDYFAPADVEEVRVLLGRFGKAAKLLAGGQSLMPQLKERTLRPSAVIDLNGVEELATLSAGLDGVSLGALVRYRDTLRAKSLAGPYAALRDAAAAIGDYQVRNRGTPVGNLAHGDHTGDIAPAAIALDAELRVVGADGRERSVPVERLWRASEQLAADELITHLSLPTRTGGSAYDKHGRVSQDRAILGVAVWVRREARCCVAARIAIGGILPGALRAERAEQALVGSELDVATAAQIATGVAEEISVQDDALASADYRRALIEALVPRALMRAWERACEADA